MAKESDLEKELAIQIMAGTLVSVLKDTQREVDIMNQEIESALEYCRNYNLEPVSQEYR
jgi:hypothetical protein